MQFRYGKISLILDTYYGHELIGNFKELYYVYLEIKRQASCMEVENLRQLVTVEKKLSSEKLYRMDLFK